MRIQVITYPGTNEKVTVLTEIPPMIDPLMFTGAIMRKVRTFGQVTMDEFEGPTIKLDGDVADAIKKMFDEVK